MKAIICFFVLLVACGVEVRGQDKSLGASCAATDTCADSGACNPTTKTCLLQVGTVCGSNAASCVTGTTCGTDSGAACECAIGYSGSTDKWTCIADGTFGGACKAGDTCDEENTKCEEAKCVCDGKREGDECIPIPAGTFGGACKDGDTCDEENTKCEEAKCVCTDKREGDKCTGGGASGLVISVVALMLMTIAGRIIWA